MVPSGNQTWRAGKYTIEFSDFPIEPSTFGWISQLPTFDDTGGYKPCPNSGVYVGIMWGLCGGYMGFGHCFTHVNGFY